MIRGVIASPGIRRLLALRNPGDRTLRREGDADPLGVRGPPGPVDVGGGRDAVTLADRLPGDLELHSMCATARRIAGLCDLMKIPGPDVATYDPDPPYIWDV